MLVKTITTEIMLIGVDLGGLSNTIGSFEKGTG